MQAATTGIAKRANSLSNPKMPVTSLKETAAMLLAPPELRTGQEDYQGTDVLLGRHNITTVGEVKPQLQSRQMLTQGAGLLTTLHPP